MMNPDVLIVGGAVFLPLAIVFAILWWAGAP